MFSGFYQLDLRKEEPCVVALVILRWSIGRNRVENGTSRGLVMIVASGRLLTLE